MPRPSKKNPGRVGKSKSKKPSTQTKFSNKISIGKAKTSKKAVVKQASMATPKRTQALQSRSAQASVGRRSSGQQSSGDGRARQPKANPVRTASVKQYEAAVKLLYSREYDKAKLAFEKLITAFPDDKEVVERSRIHLRLCEQKIARKPPAPRTLDEHYDLAIALMNEGKFDESLDHLNKALKSNPKCDYVLYALAITHCRTGNFERALANLQTAIDLKPENRFLAQRDSDFEVLKQDSRFVSLVFPDQSSVSIR